VNDNEYTNTKNHALSGIWTQGLSVQAIKTTPQTKRTLGTALMVKMCLFISRREAVPRDSAWQFYWRP